MPARTRSKAAKASVDIARFQLEQARTALLHFDGDDAADRDLSFSIKAPTDGTVLRIEEKSSRMIQAGEPAARTR